MSGRVVHVATAALAALLASGCGGDDQAPVATDASGNPVAALPAPQVRPGAVTGMPDTPGPGQPGPPAEVPPTAPVYDAEGNLLPPTDQAIADAASLPIDPAALPAAGLPPGEAVAGETALAESSVVERPQARPDEAVDLVRRYYQAIGERRFESAHALWAGQGRASGQSLDQFARGFANTASVSMDLMAPPRVSGAPGNESVEVPVAIESTQRDGSVRRLVGVYSLRRADPAGTDAGAPEWRIAAADLREVQP